MITRPRNHLDGPPLALPAALDRLAERWWRARPRARAALVVTSIAILTLATVARVVASSHEPAAVAWVATRDLGIGDQLGPGDLRRTSVPPSLLPDGAMAEPVGTLVAPLPRGAVATDRHLGDTALASTVPAGRAMVPIPIDALPDVPAGTRLDVVASDHGTARVVARDALVVQADAVAVWVAVDHADAAALAAATLHGAIGVVVVPP